MLCYVILNILVSHLVICKLGNLFSLLVAQVHYYYYINVTLLLF